MPPNARRMMHEALDLFLDALSEVERETPKRRRHKAERVHAMPEGVDEFTLKRAEQALKRAASR